MTLADAAYHSGKGLEGCARRGQSVAMPETRQQLLGDPYHKDRFTYDEHSDSFRCPQGQRLQFLRIQRLNGVPWRLYRASEGICQPCPAFGVCTKSKEFGRSVTIGPYDAALRRHRVWMSTNEARDAYKRRKPLVEPVFGIIKEQLAARRFLLRGFANVSGRVDSVGHSLQPAHPLASVAPRRLGRTTSRPKASLRFLNRRDSSGHPLVAVPPPAFALQASPCGEHR